MSIIPIEWTATKKLCRTKCFFHAWTESCNFTGSSGSSPVFRMFCNPSPSSAVDQARLCKDSAVSALMKAIATKNEESKRNKLPTKCSQPNAEAPRHKCCQNKHTKHLNHRWLPARTCGFFFLWCLRPTRLSSTMHASLSCIPGVGIPTLKVYFNFSKLFPCIQNEKEFHQQWAIWLHTAKFQTKPLHISHKPSKSYFKITLKKPGYCHFHP